MQFKKDEFETGKQWARSSHLAKREQPILATTQTRAEALKSRNDRIREWGERARAEQTGETITRSNGVTTRTRVLTQEEVRHVGRPNGSYPVGDVRHAPDGTQWKRIA